MKTIRGSLLKRFGLAIVALSLATGGCAGLPRTAGDDEPGWGEPKGGTPFDRDAVERD